MKALVLKDTGQILGLVDTDARVSPKYDNEELYQQLDLGTIDPEYVKAQTDGEGGWELIEDADKKESEHWNAVRAQRNAYVYDCDEAHRYMSWAESGTPWTQQQKDDWRNYRQALLDVPQAIQADIDSETLDSVLDVDPETYSWPTKPAMP